MTDMSPIEKLAAFYPEVAALVRERAHAKYEIGELRRERDALRARDEAVDALRSVWVSSPATRIYVDDRYPGLGHVIDRVIRPHGEA